jgi:asparagine synthase (glutamine-hydrolysing)
MCGINGVLRLRPDAPPLSRDELLRTRDSMRSRGPDGEGAWFSPDGTIALGHRRLAIIDLSPGGAQPMARAGRYRLVFNGEIYNYRELRKELEADGAAFQSQSDSEVILALYEREQERLFPRLRGMYALAVWDEAQRQLVLARDPDGVKPLYYATDAGQLRFASQVRALEAGGAVSTSVDPAGLVGFLLWGSVPEPFTIREAVRAVPAGHALVVRDGRVHEPQPHHRFGAGPMPHAGDVVTAVEDSVRAHLVADVPVGVFLSAGLDSAMLAAVAARARPEPLTTLTVRFEAFVGTPADEGPLAAELARALGTRHLEQVVPTRELVDVWPQALAAMDQPSIDGFNTWLVSRVAARQGLKVILSGLGGDELFGSYPSFRQVPRWAQALRGTTWLAGLAPLWRRAARRFSPTRPKLAGSLTLPATLPGAYLLRRGLFLPEELGALVGSEVAEAGLRRYDPFADAGKCLSGPLASGWPAVHAMESTQYMRNQLLRDCDWASMAHSLEVRVPFVDTRLRAAVAAAGYEPARSAGKRELAERVAPGLPLAVANRRKTGFVIPAHALVPERGRHTAGLDSRALALQVLDAFGMAPR